MSIDRICLGLAALGRPAYINLGRGEELPRRDVEAMRAATFDVLDAAYSAGVRRVDAARSYGRAEEFLGEWLDDRRHTDVVVSSKWGYAYVGEWRLDADIHETKEHSLDRFVTQWAESRALLGTAISLYQVHSLTTDSPLFEDRELLDALAGLAADGVALGFSTSGPRQADVIRRAMDLKLFSAVQSTWNLLETSAGDALAEAHDAGLTVLVKETMANGRLVVDPPEPLTRAAERLDATADAVAVASVLAQPWADVVLIGPSSVTQLDANLAGTRLVLDSVVDLAEDAEAYWAERSGLSWQ